MQTIIIDGSFLTYKSFFAFKNRHLSIEIDGNTITTSSVFGFLREIIRIAIGKNFPTIMVAWDKPPYLKKTEFPSYKERPKREDVPSMALEKELIIAILHDLCIPSICSNGYEGEDVINSIIKLIKKEYEKIYAYTNDEDCFALLSKNVFLINSKRDKETKRSEFDITTKKDLFNKYSVTPKEFRYFKALTGCRSDTVSGVNGIGPSGAKWLINTFGNLDKIKANLNNIKKQKPTIAKKLRKAYKDGSLETSIYLTRIQTPINLIRLFPETNLGFKKILEFIEAETLLEGSNLLTLRKLKESQTKVIGRIERKIKWKNEKL
uniref:Putative exonuclease n=1 Tax=viral metagenome TaxID=1070528 RepID=A0A6M3KAP2_9ZZZZ